MNGLRRAVMAALAMLMLLPGAAAADIPAPPSEWYKLPGLNAASGAQWVRSFAHGTPPNMIYAGLEGGGVFRSTNGGITWEAFNNGFPNPLITNVRALLASQTGTTVWAGTDDGVWKSENGGAWKPIAQGEPTEPGKRLQGSVQSLISLPGNIMLAGVASGGVYKSTDGGETWSPPPPNNGMPSHETPYHFVGQPPPAPAFVLSASSNGIFRSTDQGSTWTLASDGIPSVASPIAAWVDTEQPNLIYVSTGSNGIYRSVNSGITYSEINDNLGAVRARGFQIFTADEGAHLYAATEEGLWEALQGHAVAPPPVRWRPVTQEGLHETNPVAHNVIMWSLTAPVIPGGGALGLMAGTQSNGGYFLSFEPPDSNCPFPNTASLSANCPRIDDTTPIEGFELEATPGIWEGTELIEFAYQWQRCTGTADGDCTDIADAEETTYLVPANSTFRYRVKVTATNPAPTFDEIYRTSAITSPAGANPANFPGSVQGFAPDISVIPSEHATSPEVGDSLYAEFGQDPPTTSDGWFNPPAAAGMTKFQWLRCEEGAADCDEIPGATARTYVLQPADGTRTLKVRVTGTNASGSRALTSGASYFIISKPAEIGDPIPDPDGGPAKSQAPAIAGNAWVGETLAGTVGGWKDPTTDFLRRWVRCDPDGTACTYIQKVASTDAETGSTYVVREDDLGYTIRLRVTADVNDDLTPDQTDNHLPHSVEVDTPQTAVVTFKPVDPGGGGPGPGGGGADAVAPVISKVTMSNKRFAVGKKSTPKTLLGAVIAATKTGTTFRFTLSEPSTVRLGIAKRAAGRRVGGKCKAPTKKNRKRKKCKRFKSVVALQRGLPAGAAAVPFTGRVGKKRLKPGTHRVRVIARDAAGNASAPKSASFKVVRK